MQLLFAQLQLIFGWPFEWTVLPIAIKATALAKSGKRALQFLLRNFFRGSVKRIRRAKAQQSNPACKRNRTKRLGSGAKEAVPGRKDKGCANTNLKGRDTGKKADATHDAGALRSASRTIAVQKTNPQIPLCGGFGGSDGLDWDWLPGVPLMAGPDEHYSFFQSSSASLDVKKAMFSFAYQSGSAWRVWKPISAVR